MTESGNLRSPPSLKQRSRTCAAIRGLGVLMSRIMMERHEGTCSCPFTGIDLAGGFPRIKGVTRSTPGVPCRRSLDEPATDRFPVPAVAQGTSKMFARAERPLPLLPRKRESTG